MHVLTMLPYMCMCVHVSFTVATLDINGANFLTSKKYGNPAFFSFSLGVDDKNSSVYITEVLHCYVLELVL